MIYTTSPCRWPVTTTTATNQIKMRNKSNVYFMDRRANYCPLCSWASNFPIFFSPPYGSRLLHPFLLLLPVSGKKREKGHRGTYRRQRAIEIPGRRNKKLWRNCVGLPMRFLTIVTRPTMTTESHRIHPILFPTLPTPITHPPSRFQFNFDTSNKNSIYKTKQMWAWE